MTRQAWYLHSHLAKSCSPTCASGEHEESALLTGRSRQCSCHSLIPLHVSSHRTPSHPLTPPLRHTVPLRITHVFLTPMPAWHGPPAHPGSHGVAFLTGRCRQTPSGPSTASPLPPPSTQGPILPLYRRDPSTQGSHAKPCCYGYNRHPACKPSATCDPACTYHITLPPPPAT